jgi:hypothetical protein
LLGAHTIGAKFTELAVAMDLATTEVALMNTVFRYGSDA